MSKLLKKRDCWWIISTFIFHPLVKQSIIFITTRNSKIYYFHLINQYYIIVN